MEDEEEEKQEKENEEERAGERLSWQRECHQLSPL